MKKYASYVRDFALESPLSNSKVVVADEVWIALRNTFAEAPLFPNLRKLSMSDQTFEYASLFGTQHLSSLEIRLETFHPSLVDFFARCPDVISLSANFASLS